LNLSSGFLVSKFAFKFNLRRYNPNILRAFNLYIDKFSKRRCLAMEYCRHGGGLYKFVNPVDPWRLQVPTFNP
jgi:hypothetical protein